jgi:RHS repeat-associated protein
MRSLVYNTAGQLVSETVSGGIGDGLGLAIGYDALLRKSNSTAKQEGTTLISTSYSYDGGSRLSGVNSGGRSVGYNYLAGSSIVGQIAFNQSGTAMTTTKTYDSLDRLCSISSAPATGNPVSHTYQYNAAGQREQVTLANGTYWTFGYNDRGEVTSGGKKLSGGTNLNGYQFGYTFDAIGNRIGTVTNGRNAIYSPNSLNQYLSHTVPGYVNVVGEAKTDTTVAVNGQATSRQNTFYHRELAVANSTDPKFLSTEVTGTRGSDVAVRQGKVFVPKTPEQFSYDADGNLLSDGRWNYTWDGENRLIVQETTGTAAAAGAPRVRLSFTYDYMSRRTSKKLERNWSGSSYQDSYTMLFLWDGWNMVAEVLQGGPRVRTYAWGIDLSGTPQGAGGVGGLLFINQYPENKSYAVGYDGNGNVTALFDMAEQGAVAAQYEYGPFGEPLVVSGPYAEVNPIRWSTKYVDWESGFAYYGYRFYNPVLGRWLSRDPINELGFKALHGVKINRMRLREETNLYAFVANNPVDFVDPFGLAYFAYRPLGGPLDIFGVTGNDLDDSLNTVIGHEQIFFEDGKSPSNIGFFDDSALNSESDTSKYRSSHDKGWNDCVMRKAVAATPAGNYCLLGKPGPTEKFNCQDWAEAVRKTYRRLLKRQKVVAECCPTDAEKKK